MANPIMVQLAQGIIRPSFSVTLKVKLFCGGIQFCENFTLCDLDHFDVIIGNTFLDAYEVNIFRNGVRAKCGFKLMNLNVDYNSTW
jgi:hypothetical protein